MQTDKAQLTLQFPFPAGSTQGDGSETVERGPFDRRVEGMSKSCRSLQTFSLESLWGQKKKKQKKRRNQVGFKKYIHPILC